MTDIPDDQLVEILQVTKKIAKAAGCEDFNVLQNNGRAAHQEVDHVGLDFPFIQITEGEGGLRDMRMEGVEGGCNCRVWRWLTSDNRYTST